MSSSLEEELLRLQGVAEAQVDVAEGRAPSGVRVRLASDADAAAVGAEVQRVLAAHGLRSRLAGPDEQAPPRGDVDEPGVISEPVAGDVEGVDGAGGSEVPIQPVMAGGEAPGTLRVSSLRMQETADAVTVTATTTDGRSITQRSGNSERGLFEAVVAAVGALAEGTPPGLLAIEFSQVDGSEVLTVVLERRDGSRHAGAAVVRAARPYAVAVATWAALRG